MIFWGGSSGKGPSVATALALWSLFSRIGGAEAGLMDMILGRGGEELGGEEHRPSDDSVPEGQKHRVLHHDDGPKPVQTYFIPLPEDYLNDSFEDVTPSKHADNSPVNTIISIATIVPGVVLWYDQWEDGYEDDVTHPTQSSTLVWGDGDPNNGCIEMVRNPSLTSCWGVADEIYAGEAFILESKVYVPRNPNTHKYDGGDIVRASFPIAVTRAAYPDTPGSAMAGAVEVMETKTSGITYHPPAGTDSGNGVNTHDSFTLAELYVMATEDNTVVTYDGNTQGSPLNAGETLVVKDVEEGKPLVATKPVSVYFITGHKDGFPYEMRWYSLLPTIDWYNDYYTPVHDTGEEGSVVVLFNPTPNKIQVKHEGKNGLIKTYEVPSKESKATDKLPSGSGSRFYTDAVQHQFFALTVTDYDHNTEGEYRDWGHPCIPANKLTSQALIGMGYGCTNNYCPYGKLAASVVWVTPAEDADIHVDYDGDGIADQDIYLGKLHDLQLTDDDQYNDDQDMTGARIWATKPGDPNMLVRIAVAWGQDPNRFTYNFGETNALDMGTVVPPLPEVAASKFVSLPSDGDHDGNGRISAGDTIEYTIRLTNTGPIDVPEGSLAIIDDASPCLDQADYILFSTKYHYNGTVEDIDDYMGGFPLDNGISTKADLLSMTAHQITYRVKIYSELGLTSDVIENRGRVMHSALGKVDSFRTRTPLYQVDLPPQGTVPLPAGPSQCHSLDVEFKKGATLRQMGFYADTTDCIDVKVYLADEPITTDEITYRRLDHRWEKFCESTCYGRGSWSQTLLDKNDCTPTRVEPYRKKFVHITTEPNYNSDDCKLMAYPYYKKLYKHEHVNDEAC